MAKFVNSACCWGIRGWHLLRSSEGSASSLLRCLVISDHLRAGSRLKLAVAETEKQRDIISVAVVPSKQKIFVQSKLKNNNVRLIRYNCSTRLLDALHECIM